MKQNKYFSISRFINLLRNDWLINKKTYLLTLVGYALAIYGLSYFLMYTTRHFTNSQYTGLFMFYLMGIGFVIGTSFPALTDQIKTINYLLAPGSNLEKFMVQFVNRIVLFIPLALTIFWVATHLAKASLVPDPANGFDPYKRIEDFHFWNLFNSDITNLDRFIIILCVFSFLSLLFAGSAGFKRFSLIKTLIVLMIMIGTVVLSFVLFSHIFYPAETQSFHINLESYKITKDLSNLQLAGYLLGGLSWLFFLPLAYFKLKEKEV